MKLLSQYDTVSEAENISELLRRKGIAAYVSSKKSHGISVATGAVRVGLWVVLDHQQKDAVALMNDSKYKVLHPISDDELAELESEAKKTLVSNTTKILYPAFIFIGFVTLFVALYLAKIWDTG